MKTLYAIPNYECNLDCYYCDIRKLKETYNERKFLKTLKDFEGEVILFGGEPLLYKDRLFQILSTNKIDSISTNLLLLDLDIYTRLKSHKVSITTTWGKYRFGYDAKALDLYTQWKQNLAVVKNAVVLITLTPDIIKMTTDEFFSFAREWTCKGVLFEQLIDSRLTKEYYDKVDEWLCKISSRWTIKPKNMILDKLDHWYFDCSEVYTLKPNGLVENKCPHHFQVNVCMECMNCSRVAECKPCVLQQYCTFPHKLYERMK